MRYFIIFTAIILMFGCGEETGETIIEKAIESETGGNAEVDIEENSFRLKTEEGEMSMTAGDSVKLPDDFPEDVYLYKGADLNMAMEFPEAVNLTFETKDDMEKVSQAYLNEMLKKGWGKEMSMDMGGRKMMVFKKDDRTANVSIASDEEMTQIALTVAKE